MKHDIKNREYLHRDLKKIFPWASPRTMIYWVERGLVHPSIEDAKGRGTSRRYSYKNLIEIAFISELLSHGLPFRRIETLVRSAEYRKIIDKGSFESVFWFWRQTAPSSFSQAKDDSWAGGCGWSTFDEFLENGAEQVFGKDGGPTFKTSAMMVSFLGLERFVTEQLKLKGVS